MDPLHGKALWTTSCSGWESSTVGLLVNRQRGGLPLSAAAGLTIEARVLWSVVIVSDRDRLEHPVTPERSLDQRIDALKMANEVRSLRAQLKRDLKASRVSMGALLLDPPPCLETAKVLDMLLAIPKVGRIKATKILDGCRVSPSKTFGGLSDRQRAELAARMNQ